MYRKLFILALTGIAAFGLCAAAGASVSGEALLTEGQSLSEGTVSRQGLLPEGSDLEKVAQNYVEALFTTYSVDDAVWDEFAQATGIEDDEQARLRGIYTTAILSDEAVGNLVGKFDRMTCRWPDIDYDSQDRGSWATASHLSRMVSLAKVYRAGSGKWQGSEEILSLIHKGLSWWCSEKPQCPNWWYNDINVPQNMGRILVLMRPQLTEAEIEAGVRVMEQAKFGMTGQNKVWLAGNNLVRGLIIGDEALVEQARDYIAEEIRITEDEGIRDDWSFQQHGPQIQFGNYGLSYADELSFWLRALSGTKYAFTAEQTDILSNLIIEGIRWCVFRGVMDPSYCGRQVFIDRQRQKAQSLAVSAQNMSVALNQEASVAVGERAVKLYEQARLFADLASKGVYLPGDGSSAVGAKYYRRSDCGIYRTSSWYASVRMHSERTVGFEFTNSENTLANFSADGAVILMQDGREFENIFACWDWRKVPGVTAYDNGKPIKRDDSLRGKRNRSEHVAGAVAETSTGTVMAASMELNRDGLHALKSTFFFGDCIVALGSGITVSDPEILEVTTAVDQTRLVGYVSSGRARGSASEPKGSAAEISAPLPDPYDQASDGSDDSGSASGDVIGDVAWAHHNGRGYVSLDGAGMTVSQEVQHGRWGDLLPIYGDRTDEMPVFKCWFAHPLAALAVESASAAGSDAGNSGLSGAVSGSGALGTAATGGAGSSAKGSAATGSASGVGRFSASEGGSYAYAILPQVSASQTAAFYKQVSKGKAQVSVLLNTAACQAVRNGSVVCIVAHEAGNYEIDGQTFAVDAPCILICEGETVLQREDFPESIQSVAGRVFERAAFQFSKLASNVSGAEAAAGVRPADSHEIAPAAAAAVIASAKDGLQSGRAMQSSDAATEDGQPNNTAAGTQTGNTATGAITQEWLVGEAAWKAEAAGKWQAATATVRKLYPRTLDQGGRLVTSDLKWWCSGFFPGCLWLMYEYTGDGQWKDLALKYTLPLEPLRYRTDDHDIGFQLMTSFGNALRLTGDTSFEAVLTDGAASLATRFNPAVGCVQSWNNKRWEFPVIIDNMMNLELLLTGSLLSGDKALGDVAVSHALTTMKNHFRDDYSTFHLVSYDPHDGSVVVRQTVQGLADDSAWSRGQSWALYGYTMAYRYTRDRRFLDQAKAIAAYLIPRLPEDGVPYWDYDSPEIPNDLKDASAGAIMASALVELSGYVGAEQATRYLRVARKIVDTLSSDEYLSGRGEEEGFLLRHSVGSKPGDSEVDVPLTYADYYLLEALLRFLRLDY